MVEFSNQIEISFPAGEISVKLLHRPLTVPEKFIPAIEDIAKKFLYEQIGEDLENFSHDFQTRSKILDIVHGFWKDCPQSPRILENSQIKIKFYFYQVHLHLNYEGPLFPWEIEDLFDDIKS